MHGESASVDISSVNIQNELRKMEELLGPCDPADIMNFDETGLYYQQPPRRTIYSESLGSLKKTGIIDNFKAHFRAQQYDRALCLYITNAWLKVKPETINGMLPDLLGNFDSKFTDVSQLNLEADESEMIVYYTTSTTNNEEMAEGNINETEENGNTEQDEQRVDIVEFPLDDLDRKLHRQIRMGLADSCAELNKSKEQADLRSYFTNVSKNSSSLNSSSSASSAPKQPRLSFLDKDYIKKLYEDLNESSMWKLSSGMVVEKKMKEFVLACNFEYPVHSLILDLSDESWKKYFSDQDIAEMMNCNEKDLPALPAELNNFILEARKLPDADSFKQYLKQEFDSTACEWAKDTVLNYIKLFKYQQLPLNHQTEGDILRRI
ncbi:hypothetical protein G6F53_005856 [Rhizopus delemar]|nr:hypothetical protein G6F53_005856 [Rhizopus delemar]